MFRSDENYRFFLQKMKHHISPVASFYAYCLIPNHFHFLIKVNSLEAIKKRYAEIKSKDFVKQDSVVTSEFLMEQFSNCFNAYTKAFNIAYNRKGKLFMEHLHRKQVESDVYFTKVIHYIHANSLHHGLAKKFSDWPYSSYSAFLKNTPTMLERSEVLDWFGGKERYVKFHK